MPDTLYVLKCLLYYKYWVAGVEPQVTQVYKSLTFLLYVYFMTLGCQQLQSNQNHG